MTDTGKPRVQLMDSLSDAANVAVIGASGGIGQAFVSLLAKDEGINKVYAFSREPVQTINQKVVSAALDLTDEFSIEAAASSTTAEGPLDLVIVATGILHAGTDIRPERSMREIESRALSEVFAVNTIGPTLVAKHFLPQLHKQHKTVFAVLSARVGSIEDNRLGGWSTYRMSKAALNMMVRTLAIEQSRVRPQSLVVALHPGTVDTPLSHPFTKNYAPEKLFTPVHSATRLIEVMNGLQASDSGRCFAYDGSAVPF